MKRSKVTNRAKRLYPLPTKLTNGQWAPPKAEMRDQTAELVAKYLRSKKKGRTIKKIPTGKTSGYKSAWGR